MTDNLASRIARREPPARGRLELPGTLVSWDDEGILVEFDATTDFRVRPGEGSLQLSRTTSRGGPAAHLELRTLAGRLQLIAPCTELEGLPEIDGRGARVTLDQLVELAAAAFRLDVDASQIETAALQEPDESEPLVGEPEHTINLNPDVDKNAFQRRSALVFILAIALLVIGFFVFAWSSADGEIATNSYYDEHPNEQPGVPRDRSQRTPAP